MTSILDLPKARPVTPLGILAEKLEKAVQLIEKADISPEIAETIQQAYQLASGLDPYLEKCTTSESEALENLAEKTQKEPWNLRFSDGETVRHLEQEMLSGHIEGQTLKLFVQMMNAKRILEVGMFTGYSALAMAEALPDDGELIACEVDEYVAKFARDCFDASPDGKKIKIEVAPALETMKKLADAGESFELVFIDADKKEYVDYFNLLLDRNLLAENGIICVDNSLLQGQPYLPENQRTANGQAIAEFNHAVANDHRVEQVLLPLRDGLTLIRRK
ncbi:methyltransferase domain protein [Lyngbya aestuarii BL J]|mgnify:CR=1 FL=1|uniref:Methyltransferase domain protein n=1 Tax=Lyngbya aestuarii BL J TaxID=1348334 RepID=U7QBG8_9CYAN|nr:class I SAM-dependent methyltransferase [Lyngbya aestuarii]ERT05204.1 methyltransferase domain protein [Lyngbya aestuarii BL J]